jgi:23S rRNA (guanosine2251-2'-O)-methyltransferase
VAPKKPDRRSPRRSQREVLNGIHPVREALRARRRTLHELCVRSGTLRPEVQELVALAEAAAVPVRRVAAEQLAADDSSERGGGGVELAAGPLPEVALESLLASLEGPTTLVALDGVEDPQNLGAITRVAEAAGAAGLLLTHRRSPPLSPAVARASAGAIEWLPVARVPNLPRTLNFLKKEGYWIFGTDPDAADELFGLPDRLLTGDRVVVLGSEGRGLRPGVDQVVDHRVKIPMGGRVGSLNVSTAAAVMLFELQRRSRLATSR